jgi:hypothetical protein
MPMDKARALAALLLLLLSLGSCSRHEHLDLAPVNYSPSPSAAGPSDVEIRTTIIQQSITSYQGPCPCPYSGPTCQGHSAYENPAGQSVYCYTKDVPADMVSTYRVTLASRPSNDEARGGPITAPYHP